MPTARKARTRAGEPAVEKKPPEPDDPEVGDGLGELVEVAPRIELLGVSEKWRTFDVGLAMASMARTRGDVGLYAATLEPWASGSKRAGACGGLLTSTPAPTSLQVVHSTVSFCNAATEVWRIRRQKAGRGR